MTTWWDNSWLYCVMMSFSVIDFSVDLWHWVWRFIKETWIMWDKIQGHTHTHTSERSLSRRIHQNSLSTSAWTLWKIKKKVATIDERWNTYPRMRVVGGGGVVGGCGLAAVSAVRGPSGLGWAQSSCRSCVCGVVRPGRRWGEGMRTTTLLSWGACPRPVSPPLKGSDWWRRVDTRPG